MAQLTYLRAFNPIELQLLSSKRGVQNLSEQVYSTGWGAEEAFSWVLEERV
jgi:hypothetical protein